MASVLAAAVAVAAFTVNAVIISHPLALTGYLEPRTVTELNFDGQAPITQVLVRPGDAVVKGQVLARQDVTAVQAKILADEAQLTADQITVEEAKGPLHPEAAQQLQAKLQLAESQLAAAQAKAVDTASVDSSSITTDSNYVSAQQSTALADQALKRKYSSLCATSTATASTTSAASNTSTAESAAAGPDSSVAAAARRTTTTTVVYPVTVPTVPISIPSATTPTVPLPTVPSPIGGGSNAKTSSSPQNLVSTCAQLAHQVAVDAASVVQAQGALQVAGANARLDHDSLDAELAVSADEVAVAQADDVAGLVAPTPAQLAQDEANVAKDNAAIAADQVTIAGSVIAAPSQGIVASVGGVIGDIASSDGVKYFTAAQALPQATSSGINLFPQAPSQQTQQPSPSSAAITLDSFAMRIVVQVPQSDIKELKANQRARATVPAAPAARIVAYLERIEPEPINEDGHVYYLVDLGLRSDTKLPQTVGTQTLTAYQSPGQPQGYLSGLTVDVNL